MSVVPSVFPAALAWRGRQPATSFAVSPYRYPGTRPEGSYAVGDGLVWGLDPVDGGWADRDTGERVDLTDRTLVLAYGSNADPAKLAERLAGTVFVLRCEVRDHSAVWCEARRRSDAAVVCTIAADPGWVEWHHVLAVTRAQHEQVDAWEGHPRFYRRSRFTGPLELDSGWAPDEVWVYVGTDVERPVLLVDGHPLRVAEHGQDHVDRLVHP